MDKIMYTPEGVRDQYGSELKKKKQLMARIADVAAKYGYEEIVTPMFEYFDVFGSAIGTTPSKELYKFFDREGNTLVLRPDFTPSIARCFAAHYADGPLPVRLCYEGNTFVNAAEMKGTFKETTQTGIELIGENSAKADAEVLSFTAEALEAAGFTEYKISIGEMGFFRALTEEAQMDTDLTEEVRRLILRKNYYAIGDLLRGRGVEKTLRRAFETLPHLLGTGEILSKAEEYTVNEKMRVSLTRLKEIYELLCSGGLKDRILFDFGALHSFHYYTGIIFSAFTYGSGLPVAKGGRYDDLLSYFGADAPAVGCGIPVDTLIDAAVKQGWF